MTTVIEPTEEPLAVPSEDDRINLVRVRGYVGAKLLFEELVDTVGDAIDTLVAAQDDRMHRVTGFITFGFVRDHEGPLEFVAYLDSPILKVVDSRDLRVRTVAA